MPKFGNDVTVDLKGHSYSTVAIDKITENKQSVTQIVVDTTLSTTRFAKFLKDAVLAGIEACATSKFKGNVLLRLTEFNTDLPRTGAYRVREIFGFNKIGDIDISQVPDMKCQGTTNLAEATLEAVQAVVGEAYRLEDNDIVPNGFIIIITDGEENDWSVAFKVIKDEIEAARKSERLLSLTTLVIAVNGDQCRVALEEFKDEAGMDHLETDITPANLQKVTHMVSTSITQVVKTATTAAPTQQDAVDLKF